MSRELPPNTPNQEFELGQKVKIKPEFKEDLAHIDLEINPDQVLTISEYHINNDDENGDTVILTDEDGIVSGHISVFHLKKVIN